jgi:hypothetical protein
MVEVWARNGLDTLQLLIMRSGYNRKAANLRWGSPSMFIDGRRTKGTRSDLWYLASAWASRAV